jgi:hypothetical protein
LPGVKWGCPSSGLRRRTALRIASPVLRAVRESQFARGSPSAATRRPSSSITRRTASDSAYFRGFPVFARPGRQFESHLGHSVSAGQRLFVLLLWTKLDCLGFGDYGPPTPHRLFHMALVLLDGRLRSSTWWPTSLPATTGYGGSDRASFQTPLTRLDISAE